MPRSGMNKSETTDVIPHVLYMNLLRSFQTRVYSDPVELGLRECKLRRHRRRAGGVLRLSPESAALRPHQLCSCHQPGGTVS